MGLEKALCPTSIPFVFLHNFICCFFFLYCAYFFCILTPLVCMWGPLCSLLPYPIFYRIIVGHLYPHITIIFSPLFISMHCSQHLDGAPTNASVAFSLSCQIPCCHSIVHGVMDQFQSYIHLCGFEFMHSFPPSTHFLVLFDFPLVGGFLFCSLMSPFTITCE